MAGSLKVASFTVHADSAASRSGGSGRQKRRGIAPPVRGSRRRRMPICASGPGRGTLSPWHGIAAPSGASHGRAGGPRPGHGLAALRLLPGDVPRAGPEQGRARWSTSPPAGSSPPSGPPARPAPWRGARPRSPARRAAGPRPGRRTAPPRVEVNSSRVAPVRAAPCYCRSMAVRPKRSNDPVKAAHELFLEIIGEAPRPVIPESTPASIAKLRGAAKGGAQRVTAYAGATARGRLGMRHWHDGRNYRFESASDMSYAFLM